MLCRRLQCRNWSFLDGLLNHVVKELNVEEVLKSPIFVVQKAAAPKNGVEFCQGSNGTIRSSLATSCDVSRRRARSPNFDQSEARKLSLTDTQTDTHTHTDRQSYLWTSRAASSQLKIKTLEQQEACAIFCQQL